jgi:4-azaleucine resistance transporter AzlC
VTVSAQNSTSAEAASAPDEVTIGASRRRLLVDGFGIAVSAAAFGFVFGLSAQRAGFEPIEAIAFSTIVFAGAAQFAAVGYVAGGVAWPIIFLLTALLNARHLLYSAALAPWLRDVPVPRRAVIAHLLTDESFALSIAHFTRIGKPDERGYWLAAIGSTFIPWNAATIVGVVAGQEIPGPEQFGLDVVFPAAMIGLAAGLLTGRREVVAATAGAAIGVVAGLIAGPSVGIVAGGLLGPLAGIAIPGKPAEPAIELGTVASAQRYSMPGAHHDRPARDAARGPRS